MILILEPLMAEVEDFAMIEVVEEAMIIVLILVDFPVEVDGLMVDQLEEVSKVEETEEPR
jgi:hypothetical protein